LSYVRPEESRLAPKPKGPAVADGLAKGTHIDGKVQWEIQLQGDVHDIERESKQAHAICRRWCYLSRDDLPTDADPDASTDASANAVADAKPDAAPDTVPDTIPDAVPDTVMLDSNELVLSGSFAIWKFGCAMCQRIRPGQHDE
jgi:hypothetical protein